MSVWLLDTGPVVAYLDRADPHHDRVARALDRFEGTLVTTGAVVTESMHFLGSVRGGPSALVELLHASRTQIYDLCQPPELRAAAQLMTRYADTPMDFADATLVLLGEGIDCNRILTLDRRGFAAYRTGRGDPFVQVLDAPAT